MLRALRPLVGALVAASLALTACTGKDAVDQGSPDRTFQFISGTPIGQLYPQAKRQTAADFKGKLITGAPFDLAATRGKPVVLNFWASWCGPCQTETPQFDLLYRKVKPKVDFVGINTKDDKGKAESFIKRNDISFPSVYDEAGETAIRLGNLPTVGLPFTVLIDKHSKVAAVYIARLSYADLQKALDKLLAER
jgi:thiol-disulfide isomerase/thioredoxin